MEMMIEMSRIANEYGLDVSIWYPAMDSDYSDPATVEFALKEWGEVFRQLPRIDAIFVPGGDPGHTQPKYLMALLEKQTANLHRYHPKAQMWVSPQGFNKRMDGRIPRHHEARAGVADRRRLRSADAVWRCRNCASAFRSAIPSASIPTSRTASPPVSRAGLGCGVRPHRGPRRHQSAAARRGDHFPALSARTPIGICHVLGRLQRRREQVRLERARAGIPTPT